MDGKHANLPVYAAMLAVVAFGFASRTMATTETVDGVAWTYTVADGRATVLGECRYDEWGEAYHAPAIPESTTGPVSVPSMLGGFPVSGIGESAFYGCDGLTGVAIPDSVTDIGDYAFYGCRGLASATLPDSVTNIGWGVFFGCSGLADVTVGNGVSRLGSYAFCDCDGLTNVTLPDGMTRIGDYAFDGCSGLAEVAIPAGVTNIGAGAFSRCGKLADVAIPDGVTSIGWSTFYECRGLKTVTMGNGVTNIGWNAFRYCTSLASLTVPGSVTGIGEDAFSGSGLRTLCVPASWHGTDMLREAGVPDGCTVVYGTPETEPVDGVTWHYAVSDGAAIVLAGDYAGDLAIPGTLGGCPVTAIGNGAFSGCTNLVALAIPACVTNVGTAAFDGCGALEAFEVAAENANYASGDGVLFDKARTEVVRYPGGKGGGYAIPGSVTAIGPDAFADCRRLTDVAIPDGVTAIGGGMFRDCSGLSAVTIGTGAADIDWSAFSGCDALESVAIAPGNANYASEEGVLFDKAGTTLLRCPAGKNGAYAIPRGVETIGELAFAGCRGLTGVEIPDGVTYIGTLAFEDCTGLAVLAVPDSVADTGWDVFWGCSALAALEVPGAWVGTEKVLDAGVPDGCAVTYRGTESGSETVDGVSWSYAVFGGASIVLAGNCAGDLAVPAALGGHPVARIGFDAFAGCTNLASLSIPDVVTNIERYAFSGCCNLATLYVPVSWEGTDMLAGTGIPEECEVVYGPVGTLRVKTASLPVAAVGTAYGVALAAAGGTEPYTWRLVSDAGNGGYAESSAENTFAAAGTAQGWQGDDSCWDLALPFAFPFFGNAYTNAKINNNGAISFGKDSFTRPVWSETVFQASPVIAVLWADLTTEEGDIHVESGTNAVTVRWEGEYYGGGAVNCSATLLADGQIVLSYGAGNADGGTIGVSAGDGATCLFSGRSGSGGMADAEDIVFTPVAGGGASGLALSADGMLSGIPETVGSYKLAVRVEDTEGATAEKELVLAVSDGSGGGGGTEWYYTVSDGVATVTGAWPAEGDLTVPSMLGGCPVRAIGESAFGYCTGLTGIVVPDGVASIGNYAFYGCSALEELAIPDGVTAIGECAFSDCSGLAGVTIPDSVASIGNYAFYGCGALTEVAIPDGVTAIGDGLFEYCGKLADVTIPDGVASIGEYAFDGCGALTELVVPDAVTNIGSHAFYDCTGLTALSIPDGVAAIGTWAFAGCSGLAALSVPGAWYGRSMLANAGVPDDCTVTYRGLLEGTETVDGVAWRYGIWNGEATVAGADPAEGDLAVPSTLGGCPVTAIGVSAFGYCTNLTGMAIPGSVAAIGNGAFKYCEKLSEVAIPDGVAEIGDDAFSNCDGLAKVSFGSGVADIGSYAFWNCWNLAEVAIPAGVVRIGNDAFCACDRLERIEVAEGNPAYAGEDGVLFDKGMATLVQCPGGKSGIYAVPASVTAIGERAFFTCGRLTGVVIPDGVTNVGYEAFSDCTVLATLSVPGTWYGSGMLADAAVPPGCTVAYRGVEPLAVATTALPEGTAGIAYEAALAATGGLAPYAWSEVVGAYGESTRANSFAAGGTAQGWRGDDDCWNLELPFPFPFFGNTYTNATINNNGAISFGSGSFTATAWSESAFKASPVIAVLWKDLRTDAGGDIWVEKGEDSVTVRWEGEYYGGGAANCAATLCKDGRIVLAYGAGNADGGTIGISAGDGMTAQFAARSGTGSMADADDIVFTPPDGKPAWLELTADGVLRGTPVAAGRYAFAIAVTDTAGVGASRELTLTVGRGGDEAVPVTATLAGAIAFVDGKAVFNVSLDNDEVVPVADDIWATDDLTDASAWKPAEGATVVGTDGLYEITVPEGAGNFIAVGKPSFLE